MIISAANERLRLARRLTRRKGREEERAFLVEGTRLVGEALATRVVPRLVLFTPEYGGTRRGAELLHRLAVAGATPAEVEPSLLRGVAQSGHPQGIVAAVPFLPEPETMADASLLLAMDRVADPGNAGALLRVAAAAAVEGVLLLPGCVDVYNPKVVRAGAGAHFHVPFVRETPWAALRGWAAGKQVLVAEARSGAPHWQVDWTWPTVLIVGGEAHGPEQEAWALADGGVHVPMAPTVESLNVAAAAAAILFEARRQRSLS